MFAIKNALQIDGELKKPLKTLENKQGFQKTNFGNFQIFKIAPLIHKKSMGLIEFTTTSKL